MNEQRRRTGAMGTDPSPDWNATERPVLTRLDRPGADTVETHPAYGTIGASRVSSTPGAVLFGSDFRHQHYMVISIRKASLNRSLSNDYVSGGEELIEVALSEAQWATFVSTPNVGWGTACTLKHIDRRPVPGIIPNQNRIDQSRGERDERVKEGYKALDDLLATVEASNLSGKAKQDLRHRVEVAKGAMGPGVEWVAQQFDEHMEKTVERAKTEVNAYATAAIMRAGLQALGAPSEPLLELNEGEPME